VSELPKTISGKIKGVEIGKSPEAKSRHKQIWAPPFNTGRENIPMKSGADKLSCLGSWMVNARPGKKWGKSPEIESQLKQSRVPPSNTGRENLPVIIGADKLW
jgi:hypothetical protein